MKKTIKLKPILRTKKNLKHYICDLLLKLIVSPDGTVAATKLKILILYKYTVCRNEHQNTVITVPVALLPPMFYDEDDIYGIGPSCNDLNDTILNWFRLNKPSLNDGQLVFSSTFYSGLNDGHTAQPLFVLDDIQIPAAEIDDLKLRINLKDEKKMPEHDPQEIMIDKRPINLQNS